MFKTVDEDDDNRLDASELLVMVSAAMETEIGADLQTAKEVLEGARDEFGESAQLRMLNLRLFCDDTWDCIVSLILRMCSMSPRSLTSRPEHPIIKKSTL